MTRLAARGCAPRGDYECRPHRKRKENNVPVAHKDIVIIGSGFGASMTGLTLARAVGKNKKILMLERGTWWTTPVSTVQDKDGANYDTLSKAGEPVQYWSSQNYFRGFIDLFTRCYRRPGN